MLNLQFKDEMKIKTCILRKIKLRFTYYVD